MRAHKEDKNKLKSSHLEKKLINTAARISKTKPKQFSRLATIEKAQQIVTDKVNFTMSLERWDKFTAELMEEPKEIPALKKLFSKKTFID